MIFDLAGPSEKSRAGSIALFSRSGSQSQRGIWFILPAHGASHIIKYITLQCSLQCSTILFCNTGNELKTGILHETGKG